jgi:hypothetical protein
MRMDALRTLIAPAASMLAVALLPKIAGGS